ncbi:MAG TPA: protein translocase subunit SecD [Candidatus Acidoferrales bacterium]|nr:protein translocase subunit SecD [Candidatus Acidoferrales bacterium]
MNSNLRWKAIFIAVVVVLCIYGLVGLPDFPTSWATVKSNFGSRIRLGLDLQGGTHLIIQVQVNEAVRQEADQVVLGLARQLRDKNIASDQPLRVSDTQVKVSNLSQDRVSDFRTIQTENFPGWDISPAPGESNGYLLTMRQSLIASIVQTTMDKAVETIRRRVDQLGLTEPFVAPYGQGENEIIVEMPGEGDPVRARSVIQTGGQLELRLVQDPVPYPNEAAALQAHSGILPPGTELIPGKGSPSPTGTPTGESWYVVDRTPIVTGRDLRSAAPRRSTTRPPYWEVEFHLSTEAAARFGPWTEQNMGRPMATVLDHREELVATINGRIEDSGVIEGQFSQEEANDLALVLGSGALPASIKYLAESTVGPSLGADSIRHGIQASITSLVVVLIFMVVYYRSSGVNAVVALLLNLVILMAALAYFGAVLTLPGIAGVILTIGMGVDSNVLIFERIREELRGGKAPVSAVDLGFKRAFLTIIDTHVTTVVSAFFLFLFGTGPVKGFAISLTIGLIANLFTSVYVSRLIFDWHLGRAPRQAELSI